MSSGSCGASVAELGLAPLLPGFKPWARPLRGPEARSSVQSLPLTPEPQTLSSLFPFHTEGD